MSTSNPSGYQHFLTEQEADLIFEKVPHVQVQELMVRSTLVNEKIQLPIEQQKAELVRRITALENGNAKQVTLENVRRAREAFQRAEGDTGSPEVQGTFFFSFIASWSGIGIIGIGNPNIGFDALRWTKGEHDYFTAWSETICKLKCPC